jgi:hypothetical protein
VTSYRYRVVYHCPDCGKNHRRAAVIQTTDPRLDGKLLIEAYEGKASHPEIVALLGEIIRCPTSQRVVTPELEQHVLEAAR